MSTEGYVEFTRALLSRLHIDSNIVTVLDGIPEKTDKGLRRMLFGESDYSKLLTNSPAEAKSNTVYRFFDEYFCGYVFMRLPEGDGGKYLFIGPYISALPPKDFIKKKADELKLHLEQEIQLEEYYRSLPIVEDESVILSVVGTLGSYIFGGENKFSLELVSYEIPDKRRPAYSSGIFDETENAASLTLEIVEENYKNEQILIDAVSCGKLSRVEMITSSIFNRGTEERLQDSLRNRKNYLIILNTVLRKAAEYGAVHPYHIHRLSSSIAKKIEELYSIEGSIELQKKMIRKYCLLVREYSLKKYSEIIGKVLTLISYDLSADLSLRRISDELNVNSSYLSAAFKRECGMTLTDYVTKKRMERAAVLISSTEKQIQAVSEECGIVDSNYFIKLFKKHLGVTPSEYRTAAKSAQYPTRVK